MGLILWIDSNTFATGLLEKAYKRRGLPFYTLDNAGDFLYLVEDLKPELLVLDSKTILDQLEAFNRQYESSELLRNLPKVMIDPVAELDFVENRVGEIKRPFDPFKIPETLQNLYKSN